MKSKLLGFNETTSELVYQVGNDFFRYIPARMVNPLKISRDDANDLCRSINTNVDINMDDYEQFMAIIEKYSLDHFKRNDSCDPEFMTRDQIAWWIEDVKENDRLDENAKEVGQFAKNLLEYNSIVRSNDRLRSKCQNILTAAEFYV